jgi:hypothetical protein
VDTQVPVEARQPHVFRASHASRGYDEIEAHCRHAVGVDRAHHVAHYSFGVLDLAVDVLDEPDIAERLTGRMTTARQRRDFEGFGRQLHYAMDDIQEQLAAARSGRLIRTVFDSGEAALFYFEIRPSQYLVAVTTAADAVEPADHAMANAVNGIRRRLRLASQNPGGFLGDPRDDSLLTLPGVAPAQAWTYVDTSTGAGPRDEAFLEIGRRAVRAEDLHYLARFEDGHWMSAVDVLEDPSLDPFFQPITHGSRRDVYQNLGRGYDAIRATMDATLRRALGTRIVRTVLDVEEGALYFRPAGPNGHLMAVTLDQSQVLAADRRFAAVADQFETGG